VGTEASFSRCSKQEEQGAFRNRMPGIAGAAVAGNAAANRCGPWKSTPRRDTGHGSVVDGWVVDELGHSAFGRFCGDPLWPVQVSLEA
jgi:hypothetical protein